MVTFISEAAEFENILNKVDEVCTGEPSMEVFAVGGYLVESSIRNIKEQGGDVHELTDMLILIASRYIEKNTGEG